MFKISGKPRKELKKKLHEINRCIKTFWCDHQMEKDMEGFFKVKESRVLSDDQAKLYFESLTERSQKIKQQLEEISHEPIQEII